MVDFRKTFFPTKEERIERLENLIELHESYKGDCITCVHYISPSPETPGFVTNYGDCALEEEIFAEKVGGLSDSICASYEYDEDFIRDCKEKIATIRSEVTEHE